MRNSSPSYNESRAERFSHIQTRQARVIYTAAPDAMSLLDYYYPAPTQSTTQDTSQKQEIDTSRISEMAATALDAHAATQAQLSEAARNLAADNPLKEDGHEFRLAA